MKKTICFLLTMILALSLATVTAFAYTGYTDFNFVFEEKEGSNVNATPIKVYAAINGGSLIDRTNEFVQEDKEWYKYLPAPEAGKTAEDYDYVDEELNIYGFLCTDADVFDHAHYSYFLRIGRFYVKDVDYDDYYFERNVKFNGVDVDELNGTCYNSGNEFALKTVTNGFGGTPAPAYEAADWAQEYIAQADELDLIPDCLVGQDLTKQITRQEFAAVAVKIYESLSGKAATPVAVNPFKDCSDPEVLKAANVGITEGTAPDEFSPNVILNREQLATMLTRVYKKVAIPGWNLPNDTSFDPQFKAMFTMPAKFADDAYISGWAKDSVYFMKAKGIIEGMGDNIFAPQHGMTANEAATYGLATREQALTIAVNMVGNLK